MTAPYTPWHERARHDDLARRLRLATLDRPAWLLCPREALARALEDRAARAGGAFVRVLDWDRLAAALDDALALPFAPPAPDARRTVAVEEALAALAATTASLAGPLRTDPFGVARALLGVVDTLRRHRWDGAAPAPDAAPPAVSGAGALVASHVALLGALVRALEDALAADGALDTVARLRRAARALAAPGPRDLHLPLGELLVDGVDRLAPLERDVLEALRDRGVRVDVAPWVEGWSGEPATALPAAPAPSSWLRAWEAGHARAPGEDASVTEVAVRDPHDEAECVARWVAERIARGDAPEDLAVAVAPEAGALARVARALARYGVASHGACASPVGLAPLWQVVRASVRLAWRGVDVVDLATVLTAPGSGLWGSDRDHLLALLRRHLPTSWQGVRETLARATTPAPTDAGGAGDEDVVVVDLDAVDPARAAQLAEARARVEALVAVWESRGPFARLAAAERAEALAAVVDFTLDRLVNPMRFREGVTEARAQASWVAAAGAIDEACRAALDALARHATPLPAHDPGVFLAAAESLLGAAPDGAHARRADGVALLADDPFPPSRPRALLVTGARRGRFPSPPPRSLVLGPMERAHLASWGGGLAELPDEAALAALAARETARLLTTPTARVVLLVPRVRANGDAVEPPLVLRDLAALLPEEARAARARRGRPTGSSWLASELGDVARTARATLLDAVAALGRGEVARAVSLGAVASASRPDARDLFAARFRPEKRYDLGDLVREHLAAAVLSPGALETMLKCRYSFLTGTLLGLRPLPLARTPSLTAQDRARVTRAALRALDAMVAEGRDPDEGDVGRAVDEAVRSLVPWADRGDMRFAREELRRTALGFVLRYLDLRRRWDLGAVHDVPDDPDAGPVTVALPGGGAVRVAPQNPRVETRVTADGARALVVDLRAGSVDGLAGLRAAGLDVHGALVPAVVAARAGGEVAAFVRLSLAQPRGDAVARDGEAELPPPPAATVVTIDRAQGLGTLRDAVLRRVGDELAVLRAPGADYAPLDPARAEALAKAGARTCEVCSMQLGCRFKLAGGA